MPQLPLFASPATHHLLDLLEAELGEPGELAGMLGRIEEAMRLADLYQCPGISLQLLRPSERMQRATAWLYQGHARELCERVNQGADVAPATMAEVLLALAEWTLQVKPNYAAQCMYRLCWLALAPPELQHLAAGPLTPGDEYEGREALERTRLVLQDTYRRAQQVGFEARRAGSGA